jgi:hypothetical protein
VSRGNDARSHSRVAAGKASDAWAHYEPSWRSGIRGSGSFNAVATLPQASAFLEWSAASAWLPPYPWLLRHLVASALVVVGATVIFETAVAVMHCPKVDAGRFVQPHGAAFWMAELII